MRDFDCVALCVDRHSGWVVAIPILYKGHSGPQIAKLMLQHQWRPFGIPSIISSDQASIFTGGWWKTMCAKLGIRHAYAQSYNHRSNGRVERAGQELIERMRKLAVEEKVNWVAALPRVLDRYHDTPNVSGLSPYEILFGRPRPIAHRPYSPPVDCEDANKFFQRIYEQDLKIAKVLNGLHDKETSRFNVQFKNFDDLEIMTPVWYRRPENTGDKLDGRWTGPCVVRGKEGEDSYLIEVEPGIIKKLTVDF